MKTLAALCTCLALALAGCNPPGKTTPEGPDGPDLQESADGVPEREPKDIVEGDEGKTFVVRGKVRTRTFDGNEGKQLLAGEKVMARMWVILEDDHKTKTSLSFRPTNRRELLPEIETTIRVIGKIKVVYDNTKSTQREPWLPAKTIHMEDCRFAR